MSAHRLLSPPSLTGHEFPARASHLPVAGTRWRLSGRACWLLRLQLTWLFGLLAWVGFWDASDLLDSHLAELEPDWLYPLLCVVAGGAGLTIVVTCSRSTPQANTRTSLMSDDERPEPRATAGLPCGEAWASRSLVGLVIFASELVLFIGAWSVVDYILLARLPYCDDGAQLSLWVYAADDASGGSGGCVPEATAKLLVGACGVLGMLATGGLASTADGLVRGLQE